ncbi:MAG TPA: DUF72 domain-containing protein [Nitrospira sp.]|nr:DUF72 domain-containing protein [Nitrospira sp.]
MGRILIGTSGWVYGAWKGRFYPATLPDVQRLVYYAGRFQTTELNYSFYHVPSAETYRKWLTHVPQDFVFALKANRLITHVARLCGVESAWSDFMDGAAELGHHLGPILLQLPPFFARDYAALGSFLEMASGISRGMRLVFEFRHASWFIEDTYRLLTRHGAALCIADGPRYPRIHRLTANFAYLRFHGRTPPEAPWYAEEQLEREARFVDGLASQGLETYVYFNNDALAHAPANAARLRELLGEVRSAA